MFTLVMVLAVGISLAHSPNPVTAASAEPLPSGAVARFGSVRYLHNSPVRSVAFSLDGKMLLTRAENDTEAHLWDVAAGKELRRFDGKHGWMRFAVFSPDGKHLATGSADRRVRLWDLATGKEVRHFPSDRVVYETDDSVAFSPDGKTLAGGGVNNVFRLWDVATGKELRSFKGPFSNGSILSLAFSPDGRHIAAAAEEWESPKGAAQAVPTGVVRLWDPATGKEVRRLEGHRGWVYGLAFSPDSGILATASADKTVRLWDVASGKELRRLRGSQGAIRAVAFVSAKTLASAGADGAVRVWDVATGKELHCLMGHSAPVSALAVSPGGKLLASGGEDRRVRLWDLATGKEMDRPGGHGKDIQAIAYSPDGKVLASGSLDNTIRLWDVASGRELHRLEGHKGPLSALAFSPSGGLLASGGEDKTVCLWEASTAKLLRRLPSDPNGRVNSVAFSGDGKSLIARDDEGILAWDVTSGKKVTPPAPSVPKKWRIPPSRKGPNLFPTKVPSPDGRVVALGRDHAVLLVEAATGEERYRLSLRRPFSKSKPEINCVAFSPDGSLMAITSVGGEDKQYAIHLWDRYTGERVGRLTGHKDQVWCLAFSPDGEHLASGSGDCTVLIWDISGKSPDRRAIGKRPSAEEMDRLWAGLADEDAGKGHRAIAGFLGAAGQTEPLLGEKLKPVPAIDPRRIPRLIAALGSENFAERKQATKDLAELGDRAEPGLRQVLKGNPSLEVRRRAEDLLKQLDEGPLPPDMLRALRSVEVLEGLRTADARRVLERLAQGAPEARLTREARASLHRMAKFRHPDVPRSGGT